MPEVSGNLGTPTVAATVALSRDVTVSLMQRNRGAEGFSVSGVYGKELGFR